MYLGSRFLRCWLNDCDVERCASDGSLLGETLAHTYTQNYSSIIPLLSTSTA